MSDDAAANDDLRYSLDVRAVWEIEVCQSLRDLKVLAGPHGIRMRDVYCGEWEMGERSAVHLDADEARQVGRALLAAAEELERHGRVWQLDADQADPSRALAEALEERAFEDSLARWSEDPPSVTAKNAGAQPN